MPTETRSNQSIEQEIEEALHQAVTQHQNGQLQVAMDLYLAILQVNPHHADTNHNVGVLALQQNRFEDSLPYFLAALDTNPTHGTYWTSYIDALIQSKKLEEASQFLTLAQEQGLPAEDVAALSIQLNNQRAGKTEQQNTPSQPAAIPHKQEKSRTSTDNQANNPQPDATEINQLISLFNQSQYTKASLLALTMTEHYPSNGFGWKALGASFKLLNRNTEALLPMKTAADLMPNDAEAQHNLGLLLNELGQAEEARLSYIKALQIKPDYAEVYCNLGVTLRYLGQLDEAESCYRKALKIKSDYPQALNNLGNILKDLNRPDEAETCYQDAIQIKPDYAEAYKNLGILLIERERLDEAIVCCEHALVINPDYVEALINLGSALTGLGLLTEGIKKYCRALEIEPDHALCNSNLLFALSHSNEVSADLLFSEHCRFGTRLEALSQPFVRPPHNSADSQRCLQIGFVSADIRNHPVAKLIEPILAHLATCEKLSLHAYYTNTVSDEYTARLSNIFAHWHSVHALTAPELANKIREDGIDILIDLSGHSGNNRLRTFALKPAPLQVSWIGYPGTTGLSAMDYYLSDKFFLPLKQFSAQFTEKIVHLPAHTTFLPSSDAPQINPLPGLTNGHLTFGSFNRINKISPTVIALWSKILRQLPESKMVLAGLPGRGEVNKLIDWFKGEGINPTRLSFHDRSNMDLLHHQVDICLDTSPYNGGSTTLHALWMGVPTISLAGNTAPSRIGASILGNVGLEAFIAKDTDDFVQIGVYWANHLNELAKIRRDLRERFLQSDIGQPAVIADGLERALHIMWQRRCAGLAPEAFAINETESINFSLYKQEESQRNNGDSSDTKQLAKASTATQAISSVVSPNSKPNKNSATRRGKTPTNQEINFLVKLFTEGHYTEVIPLAQIMTEDFPLYGFGWKALGAALTQTGRIADSLIPMKKAASLSPRDAESHSNLGNTFKELGLPAEAEISCRRAIAIKPDYAEAYNNMGTALTDLGRLNDSIKSFRRALQLKPNYAEAHNNLATALKEMGQLDNAIAGYRRALHIKPDYISAYDNLLFTLNYHPDLTAEEIFRSYQEYDTLFGIPLRSTWRPFTNDKNPTRRLRIGYVSPDFRKHSSNSFLEPLLAGHDKTKIESYAYAELDKEDALTARYKNYVAHWIPCKHMSDEVLAEKIRSDQIDILVDLAGHTTGNRLAVFARKPAPVSLSTMGFGYTTGLSAIDYFVADEASIPEGCETLFSEQLWRIKTPAFPYLPTPGMGDVNDLPALQNGYITFGTLSRSVRINHRTIRVWAELLNKVPDSKLVIDSLNFKDAQMQEKLAVQFSAHGIARDRLVMGYHSPPWDLLRSIDISLDCFPHNSGTTLIESLYMGVPFITLADRPSVGRIGSVVLIGAGHPEWISNNETDYVDKTIKLASNLGQLSEFRTELRQHLKRTILRDASGFVGKMEDAYQQMWLRWCSENK